MEPNFRCKCPITSALDIVGDKWTLVIIKQMLFEQSYTFKDFIESQESIATNILTKRLKTLEESGIIIKEKLPENKKANIYLLTEKGMSFTPILLELILWSEQNLVDVHPGLDLNYDLQAIKKNKSKAAEFINKSYLAFTQSIG